MGQFAGEAAARQEIVRQLGRVMGSDSAREVVEMLSAANQPDGLSLAAITSVVVLLFGASGVFVQLQEALNTVWNVMPDPEQGIMNTIQKRVVSFVMVLGLGVLLLVLLVCYLHMVLIGQFVGTAVGGKTATSVAGTAGPELVEGAVSVAVGKGVLVDVAVGVRVGRGVGEASGVSVGSAVAVGAGVLVGASGSIVAVAAGGLSTAGGPPTGGGAATELPSSDCTR